MGSAFAIIVRNTAFGTAAPERRLLMVRSTIATDLYSATQESELDAAFQRQIFVIFTNSLGSLKSSYSSIRMKFIVNRGPTMNSEVSVFVFENGKIGEIR